MEFFDAQNFPKEKLKDSNGIIVSFNNYKNEINEIFSKQKNNFFAYFENEKFFIDKIKTLEDSDVNKLTDILKKIEMNNKISNNVLYLFVKLVKLHETFFRI